MNFPHLLKLESLPVEKIWGGDFLAKVKKLGNKKIGETWEVSTLKEGSSFFQKQKLGDYIGDALEYFWGPDRELTYLIKFIQTSDYLSFQVHPNDEFAGKYENSLGKTECWVILGADPGCGIYLGLKEGVTREGLAHAIHRQEDISHHLNFYPVEKGDFYYVPAGTLHAIGKGVLLLEIQQSSGITYRVWDWNRTDEQGRPRELHIEKALRVINFDPQANALETFRRKKNIFSSLAEGTLVEHPQFQASVLSCPQGAKRTFSLQQGKRAQSLVCFQGEFLIHRGDDQVKLMDFESVLIPYAGPRELTVTALTHGHLVLVN